MNQRLPVRARLGRALCLAAAACSLLGCSAHQTFHIKSPKLKAAFQKWKETAPPKDRAIIEELEQDETVIIHIIEGSVPAAKSRGAGTTLARTPEAMAHCWFHPASGGIPRLRNFDVVYDHEVANGPYRFPNPPEAIFHHEIIGHVVPQLADPTWWDRPESETEPYAIERENEYRRHVGLPLAPPYKAVPPPTRAKP